MTPLQRLSYEPAAWSVSLAGSYAQRTCGLPLSILSRFCTPELMASVESESKLTRSRQFLLAALESAMEASIGLCPEAGLRKTLINARRDLRRRGRVPQLPSVDGQTCLVTLQGFVEHLRSVEREVTERAGDVRRTYEKRMELERRYLEDVSQLPALRDGIAIAASSLGEYYAKLANLRPGTADRTKKVAQMERSVLRYMVRASLKPSPFSTFCSVTVHEQRNADANAKFSQSDKQSHTHINVLLLVRIRQAVIRNMAANSLVMVSLSRDLAPAASVDEGHYKVTQSSLVESESSDSLALNLQQQLILEDSSVLFHLRENLQKNRSLSIRELNDKMAEQLSIPANEAFELLRVALHMGLLTISGLDISPDASEWEQQFANRLKEFGLCQQADALQKCLSVAAAVSQATGQERYDLLRQLTDIAHETWSGEFLVPSRLLYEDVVAFRTGTPAPLRDRHIADLCHLMPTAIILDPSRRARDLLSAYFAARFPNTPEVSDVTQFLLDFHNDINRDQLDWVEAQRRTGRSGQLFPRENWLNDRRVDSYNRARIEIRDHIQQATASGAATVDLARLPISETEHSGPHRRTLTIFVQTAGEDLVLNKCIGGRGFATSRFTSALDQSERSQRQDNRSHCDSIIYAEVLGPSVTTNLNFHAGRLSHVLHYPGSVQSADNRPVVHLSTASVRADSDGCLFLWSATHKCRIVPVFHGYLRPDGLPLLLQLLLLFDDQLSFDSETLWSGIDVTSIDSEGYARLPELRCGSIIMCRARVRINRLHIDALLEGKDGLEAMTSLINDFSRFKFPIRGFYSLVTSDTTSKPQYFDLRSPLLTDAFTASLRAEHWDLLDLCEAEPDWASNHCEPPSKTYSEEFCVELVANDSEAL